MRGLRDKYWVVLVKYISYISTRIHITWFAACASTCTKLHSKGAYFVKSWSMDYWWWLHPWEYSHALSKFERCSQQYYSLLYLYIDSNHLHILHNPLWQCWNHCIRIGKNNHLSVRGVSLLVISDRVSVVALDILIF